VSGDLHSHSGLNCEFPLCLCADGENARAQVVFKRATHEIFIGRRCSSANDGRQKCLLCGGTRGSSTQTDRCEANYLARTVALSLSLSSSPRQWAPARWMVAQFAQQRSLIAVSSWENGGRVCVSIQCWFSVRLSVLSRTANEVFFVCALFGSNWWQNSGE
jgi:hypothetical protein